MISSSVQASTIGVLICTYRRPDDLSRLLNALEHQDRLPDDVIITVRDTDQATAIYLSSRPVGNLVCRVVPVSAPGTVAAHNVGLDACLTDVLVMVDDDTVPRPDFIQRILTHFIADPMLGGLGGRDRVFDGTTFDDRQESVVGQLAWFGRAVGNHHIGYGPPRDVHFLKGANMSYRAAAFEQVRFDVRLKGEGAQPHEDFTFSLAIGRGGWRLRYDPEVLLEHYAAKRQETRYYATIGKVDDIPGFRINSYNMVVCLWDQFSPMRQLIYAVWSFLVGVGVNPGLVQALRYTPRLGLWSWRRFVYAQQGRAHAYFDLLYAQVRGTSVRSTSAGAISSPNSDQPVLQIDRHYRV